MTTVPMDIEKARFNMIQQQIRPWEVLDPGVLDLLSIVKRETFVPEIHKDLAFADLEIPLGIPGDSGKVMLPPKIEARMLQELNLKTTDKVLEIGTGSGYMAALMAAKAEFVHSVEIDPALVDMARNNLKQAGVANVGVDLGDGAHGWPLYAPYDVIVLSGSVPELPQTILRDLKVGGRLVAVVGSLPTMHLQLITRTGEDAFNTINVLETVIAPLTNVVQRNQFVF